MHNYISLLGIAMIIGLAWSMSSHKNCFPWRIVLTGLCLQFALAVLILRTTQGEWVFDRVDDAFVGLLECVDVGTEFVFGEGFAEHFFAFKVLPTIVFFSAFMSIFYYYGIMQKVVGMMAVAMQKTLGTSGAETLSAAANVFVGQTEAPLVIRPYISSIWSLEAGLSYLFYPLAWLIGIEAQDCPRAAELMGLKMATNEFVAYGRLAEWDLPNSTVHISQRTREILTYALCGFANFGSHRYPARGDRRDRTRSSLGPGKAKSSGDVRRHVGGVDDSLYCRTPDLT